MRQGKIVARGRPADLVREHAGIRRTRSTGRPARLAEVRAPARGRRAGRCAAAAGAGDPARRALDDGTLPEGVRRAANARGRVRGADRRGDRVSAAAGAAARCAGSSRAGRWRGVMSRDVDDLHAQLEDDDVLLDRRADDLPAGVRLRLRRARSASIDGLDYDQYVGTGMVATAVLFSSAFPAMYSTFMKYRFQRTYDAILAAPVDVEELVTAEMLWIGMRAGVYGIRAAAGGDRVRARPDAGRCCWCRSSAS